MKIEIYSDVMCPWCYIGEWRLQRALSAFPRSDRFDVVFRSFQLDPTTPHRPKPMQEYLGQEFGSRIESIQQHVVGVGRGEGIEFDFENGVIVNTLTAHRLLRLAEHEYGAAVQRVLAERLFEAHFERGADISDHQVLTGLAASAGMDPARVRSYLASGEGLRETERDLVQALERGIRAVPTFVLDGEYALEGAQPLATLLSILEELAPPEAQASRPAR